MQLQTPVAIAPSPWKIMPCEEMLFVGSCFADNLGRRFIDERFRATVNPFGVMYNPVSVLHTVERTPQLAPRVAVLTLGTNHVYRLKATGEIVDNCQKRPQQLFSEESLSVEACVDALHEAVSLLAERRPDVKVVVTVSPIRYAKYGFHGSQLSKATLLLAAHELTLRHPDRVAYFPSYELMMDELRDYRFYTSDMLHPSQQAIDYIYERFAEAYFSPDTFAFLKEWKPIREALAHRPFNPDGEEYKKFIARTHERLAQLRARYPLMPCP